MLEKANASGFLNHPFLCDLKTSLRVDGPRPLKRALAPGPPVASLGGWANMHRVTGFQEAECHPSGSVVSTAIRRELTRVTSLW